MSQLDVTELLTDPDFCDFISHIARVPSVNSLGENSLTECVFKTVGSVQAATGEVIKRLPEELQVANLKSFWLKGTIVASTPGQYADILTFRGKRYQVQMVFDWTNWGAGYCEGLCVAERPAT